MLSATLRAAGALLLGVALAASVSCGDKSSEPPVTSTVTITDNAFTPAPLTVARGTRVRWVNSGSAVHDVTSFNAVFTSGALAAGATFQRKFDVAGTFDYACTRHAGMQGSVVVQ